MTLKWEKMIDYWQDVQMRHALTFPFIIGSQREPIGSKYSAEEDPKDDIASLIVQASSSKRTNLHYKIYRCPDLDKLVIRRVVNSLPNGIAIPDVLDNKSSSLYVSDVFEENDSASIESLVQKIWSESGQAIMQGKYSCRSQTYGEYSDYEVNTIKKAMA